jgi:hypothetical protein
MATSDKRFSNRCTPNQSTNTKKARHDFFRDGPFFITVKSIGVPHPSRGFMRDGWEAKIFVLLASCSRHKHSHHPAFAGINNNPGAPL